MIKESRTSFNRICWSPGANRHSSRNLYELTKNSFNSKGRHYSPHFAGRKTEDKGICITVLKTNWNPVYLFDIKSNFYLLSSSAIFSSSSFFTYPKALGKGQMQNEIHIISCKEKNKVIQFSTRIHINLNLVCWGNKVVFFFFQDRIELRFLSQSLMTFCVTLDKRLYLSTPVICDINVLTYVKV